MIETENLPLLTWGRYEGALKRAITQLKYHHCPQIAEPLGEWLGQAWLAYHAPAGPGVVVPIPLHRDRHQHRGYNQAALIAHSFCRVTGLALKPRGLTRHRPTQPQFNLSRHQRHHNLEQAFMLGPDCRGHTPRSPVLLLDDIYTTGATANAAATTLQISGIPVQGVVTIAHTQSGHGPIS